MAKKETRPDQDTIDCPECGGEGVVPGVRYTEAPRACPTCKGAGVVPAEGDGS